MKRYIVPVLSCKVLEEKRIPFCKVTEELLFQHFLQYCIVLLFYLVNRLQDLETVNFDREASPVSFFFFKNYQRSGDTIQTSSFFFKIITKCHAIYHKFKISLLEFKQAGVLVWYSWKSRHG